MRADAATALGEHASVSRSQAWAETTRSLSGTVSTRAERPRFERRDPRAEATRCHGLPDLRRALRDRTSTAMAGRRRVVQQDQQVREQPVTAREVDDPPSTEPATHATRYLPRLEQLLARQAVGAQRRARRLMEERGAREEAAACRGVSRARLPCANANVVASFKGPPRTRSASPPRGPTPAPSRLASHSASQASIFLPRAPCPRARAPPDLRLERALEEARSA